MFVVSGGGCLLDVCCVRRWQSHNAFFEKKASAIPITFAKAIHRLVVGWHLEPRWRNERGSVLRQRNFLEHVCQAVGCHGRQLRRPGPDWCRCSIGELVKVADFCPGGLALTPVVVLAVEVTSLQTGVWER